MSLSLMGKKMISLIQDGKQKFSRQNWEGEEVF